MINTSSYTYSSQQLVLIATLNQCVGALSHKTYAQFSSSTTCAVGRVNHGGINELFKNHNYLFSPNITFIITLCKKNNMQHQQDIKKNLISYFKWL